MPLPETPVESRNNVDPLTSVPRITGVNHLLMVCNDMDATANFYVNILWFKLKMTGRQSIHSYADRPADVQSGVPVELPKVNRMYFFEALDGMMLAFAELPKNETTARHSFFQPNFWPGRWSPPSNPRKLDHLSFNVKTLDEVVWFQKRLRDHGIEVSRIEQRPRSLKSIYFYDPNQIPLEIATWDLDSSEWAEYDPRDYYRDPDPVPSIAALQRSNSLKT
jgi:catechol 2,3-dioxygenase-like lactoylglutathione lyase family enzyme